MRKILVIHGPNLNLLGKREVDVYGKVTIEEINRGLEKAAKEKKVRLEIIQSNHEGEIVGLIGKAKGKFDAILINPAAYTHTSIAIRDALLAINKPFVEVHLSDVKKREKFRQHSYLSDIACAVISGSGAQSYYDGFKKLVSLLRSKNET